MTFCNHCYAGDVAITIYAFMVSTKRSPSSTQASIIVYSTRWRDIDIVKAPDHVGSTTHRHISFPCGFMIG